MRTKEKQEKLRNLGKASEKLLRELHTKELYASSVVFSDKLNGFVVTIGNIDQKFEGYQIFLKPGTVAFAKNHG